MLVVMMHLLESESIQINSHMVMKISTDGENAEFLALTLQARINISFPLAFSLIEFMLTCLCN